MTKKKNWKSILFNVLKVAVSAGLLAYVLIFRVDLRALGEAIARAQWGYLAAAAKRQPVHPERY